MTYPHREAEFKATLRTTLESAGSALDDELFTAAAKLLPVVLASEIKALADAHRGWYSASSLYEAVYRQPIPSSGLAVRLGHQLRKTTAICKKIGPQRFYWIAPEGVRPPEQIGVS